MIVLRITRQHARLVIASILIAAALLVAVPTTAQAAGQTSLKLQNITISSFSCGYSLSLELDFNIDVPGAGDTAEIMWYYGLQSGSLSEFPFVVETVGPGPTSAISHESFFLSAADPQPDHTAIVFEFHDANSDAGAGLSVDCTTGAVISVWDNSPGPGPDMVAIPDTAVVGSFVQTTPIYFAPNMADVSDTVMEAGKTAWVYGVDSSGQFYKVMLAGKFFWVPVSTMGPNYDDVWNGTPLPTVVVS